MDVLVNSIEIVPSPIFTIEPVPMIGPECEKAIVLAALAGGGQHMPAQVYGGIELDAPNFTSRPPPLITSQKDERVHRRMVIRSAVDADPTTPSLVRF